MLGTWTILRRSKRRASGPCRRKRPPTVEHARLPFLRIAWLLRLSSALACLIIERRRHLFHHLTNLFRLFEEDSVRDLYFGALAACFTIVSGSLLLCLVPVPLRWRFISWSLLIIAGCVVLCLPCSSPRGHASPLRVQVRCVLRLSPSSQLLIYLGV